MKGAFFKTRFFIVSFQFWFPLPAAPNMFWRRLVSLWPTSGWRWYRFGIIDTNRIDIIDIYRFDIMEIYQFYLNDICQFDIIAIYQFDISYW